MCEQFLLIYANLRIRNPESFSRHAIFSDISTKCQIISSMFSLQANAFHIFLFFVLFNKIFNFLFAIVMLQLYASCCMMLCYLAKSTWRRTNQNDIHSHPSDWRRRRRKTRQREGNRIYSYKIHLAVRGRRVKYATYSWAMHARTHTHNFPFTLWFMNHERWNPSPSSQIYLNACATCVDAATTDTHFC